MNDKEKKLTVTVTIDIFSDGSSVSSAKFSGESPVMGLDTSMAVIAGLELCKMSCIGQRYNLLPNSQAARSANESQEAVKE